MPSFSSFCSSLSLPPSLVQSQRQVQLVPLSSPNDSASESPSPEEKETPEHLYSLGQFVATDPSRGILLRDRLQPSIPPRRASHPAVSSLPAYIHTPSTGSLSTVGADDGTGSGGGGGEVTTGVSSDGPGVARRHATEGTASVGLVTEQRSRTMRGSVGRKVGLLDSLCSG